MLRLVIRRQRRFAQCCEFQSELLAVVEKMRAGNLIRHFQLRQNVGDIVLGVVQKQMEGLQIEGFQHAVA